MTFSGSRFIRNKNKCFALLHTTKQTVEDPMENCKGQNTSRFEKALDNTMQCPKTCVCYAHKHEATTVNQRLLKLKPCVCYYLKASPISCSQG